MHIYYGIVPENFRPATCFRTSCRTGDLGNRLNIICPRGRARGCGRRPFYPYLFSPITLFSDDGTIARNERR